MKVLICGEGGCGKSVFQSKWSLADMLESYSSGVRG